MSDTETAELPLKETVGAAGAHATDAFALLADETRLAILLALWAEYDPHATDNVVPFSEIFDRVDADDPGTFSYHLQQLAGQFIQQYPDGEGYELRVPALRFIHAVIAGAGVEDSTVEPTEMDQPCPFCDAPTAITYREGLVVHFCTECEGVTTGEDIRGYLSAVPFDPAGLADRSPDEIRAASRVAAWRQTQIMFDGLCPACSGPVERNLSPNEGFNKATTSTVGAYPGMFQPSGGERIAIGTTILVGIAETVPTILCLLVVIGAFLDRELEARGLGNPED